jgi:hypothetical protein
MLQAYIDDSIKHHDGRKTLFLAGYVNSVANWIEFSKEWERVLAEPPAIEYLHMAEAWAQKGDFAGISKEMMADKVWKLSEVIKRNEPIYSFHVAVDWADFESEFGKLVPYGYQTPYMLCFLAVVGCIAKFHARSSITHPIDFILDDQESINRAATLFYFQLKDVWPTEIKNLIGSAPAFKSDKDISALQAADMLVWHLQRETVNGSFVPTLPSSFNVLTKEHHLGLNANSIVITETAKYLKSIPNLGPLASKKVWKKMLDLMEVAQLNQGPPDLMA